jgi:formylglycine-generating enzyme required for sulfatase activity
MPRLTVVFALITIFGSSTQQGSVVASWPSPARPLARVEGRALVASNQALAGERADSSGGRILWSPDGKKVLGVFGPDLKPAIETRLQGVTLQGVVIPAAVAFTFQGKDRRFHSILVTAKNGMLGQGIWRQDTVASDISPGNMAVSGIYGPGRFTLTTAVTDTYPPDFKGKPSLEWKLILTNPGAEAYVLRTHGGGNPWGYATLVAGATPRRFMTKEEPPGTVKIVDVTGGAQIDVTPNAKMSVVHFLGAYRMLTLPADLGGLASNQVLGAIYECYYQDQWQGQSEEPVRLLDAKGRFNGAQILLDERSRPIWYGRLSGGDAPVRVYRGLGYGNAMQVAVGSPFSAGRATDVYDPPKELATVSIGNDVAASGVSVVSGHQSFGQLNLRGSELETLIEEELVSPVGRVLLFSGPLRVGWTNPNGVQDVGGKRTLLYGVVDGSLCVRRGDGSYILATAIQPALSAAMTALRDAIISADGIRAEAVAADAVVNNAGSGSAGDSAAVSAHAQDSVVFGSGERSISLFFDSSGSLTAVRIGNDATWQAGLVYLRDTVRGVVLQLQPAGVDLRATDPSGSQIGAWRVSQTLVAEKAQPPTGSPAPAVTMAPKAEVTPEEAPRPRPEPKPDSSEPPPPRITNSIGMTFVWVRPGAFSRGSDHSPTTKPVTTVELSKGYYLQTTEVTQAQWEAVMGTNSSRRKGADLPVEDVAWQEALEFLARLNAKEGLQSYRLPTEAEWENACRAGGAEQDLPSDASAESWWFENAQAVTQPVGRLRANAWGLFDMRGNVSEWVRDNYVFGHANSAAVDPVNITYPSLPHVFKGGSSGSGSADTLRCTIRVGSAEGASAFRSLFVGFRTARDR